MLGMWIISIDIQHEDYVGRDILEATDNSTYRKFNYSNRAMQYLPLYYVGIYGLYALAYKFLLGHPKKSILKGL